MHAHTHAWMHMHVPFRLTWENMSIWKESLVLEIYKLRWKMGQDCSHFYPFHAVTRNRWLLFHSDIRLQCPRAILGGDNLTRCPIVVWGGMGKAEGHYKLQYGRIWQSAYASYSISISPRSYVTCRSSRTSYCPRQTTCTQKAGKSSKTQAPQNKLTMC